MYKAYLTRLKNIKKDEKSDNLYTAFCLNEQVIVGNDMNEDDLVVYLPADGELQREFGDKLNLFRKNLDGTSQGGYVENSGHIRALKLRGLQSEGIAIPYRAVCKAFPEAKKLKEGDEFDSIGKLLIVKKYVPKRKLNNSPNTKKVKQRGKLPIYPEFAEHVDTKILNYNYQSLQEGDDLHLSLKLHGTSGRSAETYREYPYTGIRKLLKWIFGEKVIPKKTEKVSVYGSRRTVRDEFNTLKEDFREDVHKQLEPFIEQNMEVYYEIVGFEPNGKSIMPSCDNSKVKDKKFKKKFGDQTVFHYGCKPNEYDFYVYRINKDGKEFTPDEIGEWCEEARVKQVPTLATFKYENEEQLKSVLAELTSDLADPIGKNHVMEGVVVRVLNRPKFTAFKEKTFEFRVIEGIIKDLSDEPNMEEAEG